MPAQFDDLSDHEYFFALPLGMASASAEVGLSERLDAMKLRRGQVSAKVRQWEDDFFRVHLRVPTDEDRQRDRKQLEMLTLMADLDEFIEMSEGGLAMDSAIDHTTTRIGHLRSQMRSWDRKFQRRYNRKPTANDHASSADFSGLQRELRALEGEEAAEDDALIKPTTRSLVRPLAPPDLAAQPPSADLAQPPSADLMRYVERALRSVRSSEEVEGIEETPAQDVGASVALFAHCDADRDGVISFEEFAEVMEYLAERIGKPLEVGRVERLFALADKDGNGVIDLNEFCAVRSRLWSR